MFTLNAYDLTVISGLKGMVMELQGKRLPNQ